MWSTARVINAAVALFLSNTPPFLLPLYFRYVTLFSFLFVCIALSASELPFHDCIAVLNQCHHALTEVLFAHLREDVLPQLQLSTLFGPHSGLELRNGTLGCLDVEVALLGAPGSKAVGIKASEWFAWKLRPAKTAAAAPFPDAPLLLRWLSPR